MKDGRKDGKKRKEGMTDGRANGDVIGGECLHVPQPYGFVLWKDDGRQTRQVGRTEEIKEGRGRKKDKMKQRQHERRRGGRRKQ
jgi:hypothetical protein